MLEIRQAQFPPLLTCDQISNDDQEWKVLSSKLCILEVMEGRARRLPFDT